MAIPWDLIARVGLQVISWIFRKAEERKARQKAFLDFIRKQNKEVYESLRLRDEYREIMAEIEKTKE